MRFIEYQDIHKQIYETPSAVMFGRVDGIDVFQNADETGLIFSETYHEPDEEVIINTPADEGGPSGSSRKVKDLFTGDGSARLFENPRDVREPDNSKFK